MADEQFAPRRLAHRASIPWTAERIAHELVPERDRLVERLPREIAAARDLTVDQRELVIDDAIDFMVTEYAKPLSAREDLDRAFWAAASYRVKRAHERRGATVRARFRRASADDLDNVAAADDPEAAVVSRDERLTLLEFVTTLTPSERQVFACKYGSGPREVGRVQLARWLEMPMGEVRKAERNIARKLDRFITLVSAGALCSFRGEAIDSLAAATATAEQVTAARLHLMHCPACQRAYAERVRALRSGELHRHIASLLPLPIVDSAGDERPIRGFLLDWITRPFGGEPAAVVTQAASSGAGRGIGTIAAVKLASLCFAGAAVTGGVCVSIQQLAENPRKPVERRESGQKRQPASTDNAPRERLRPVEQTPTPAATPKPKRSGGAARDRNGGSREHERETAVSPPPSNAQAGGVDEFGPSSASAPPEPAAAPATGAPEFP